MGGFIGKNTKRGTTTVSKKHVVIVGASGELGTAVSSAFIKEGHNVYGISSRPSHTSVHIPLNQALSYAESSKGAFDELSKHIEKVDAVICLAGGWAGGSAGDEGVFESLEKMYQANMRSALLAAHIATRLLKVGLFFILFYFLQFLIIHRKLWQQFLYSLIYMNIFCREFTKDLKKAIIDVVDQLAMIR
eukprot:TRINITY_DN3748_c0_g1_i15.p1 TRINITY_DN3748_c0_g1~~TRINITY_DN3748_c0_g1_i15.p1  ORF type:complete len:190 (+),score=23.68 TRINITY_DN3748_c0_g1_i15:64-633(+)